MDTSSVSCTLIPGAEDCSYPDVKLVGLTDLEHKLEHESGATTSLFLHNPSLQSSAGMKS